MAEVAIRKIIVFNTDEMNECERVIEMIKELSLGVNGFNESEIADSIRGNGFLTIWFCLWSKMYQDHGFWLVCLHQLDLCVV